MRRLPVVLAFVLAAPGSGGAFVGVRPAGADAATDAAAAATAEATKVATALVERLRSKDVDERRKALEEIIKFRSGGRRRSGPGDGESRGKLARDAFTYAVGADVGQDPDQMRAWWKEYEKDFDFKEAAARRAREGSAPVAKRKKAGDGAEPGMKADGT